MDFENIIYTVEDLSLIHIFFQTDYRGEESV